jgi:hypothetical protein
MEIVREMEMVREVEIVREMIKSTLAQHLMHLRVFGSEPHVKKESTFFPLNAENGFLKF